VAEIERRIRELEPFRTEDNLRAHGAITGYYQVLSFIDTLEAKDLELTWEDIRELYITFAEVDTEIELCKTDIQAETLGYYKEVLKRFKALKGDTT
jgi:hypothetical protein